MTLVQELLAKSSYGKKELARQDLIVSVTEQIWEALEASEMSKADLSRALETSKSNVTQLLDGTRNMTLSTLADIGEAVGAKPRVVFERSNVSVHQEHIGSAFKVGAGSSRQEARTRLVQTYGNAACNAAGSVNGIVLVGIPAVLIAG